MRVLGLSPRAGKPNRSSRAKFPPVYIPFIDVLHTHSPVLCAGASRGVNTQTQPVTPELRRPPPSHTLLGLTSEFDHAGSSLVLAVFVFSCCWAEAGQKTRGLDKSRAQQAARSQR